MKYLISHFVAICSLSQGNCSQEKVYVQPNQISITEQGIFVFVNNHWFPVESLQADARGVYADAKNWWNWKCPSCKYEDNPWHSNVCVNCGRRP